MEARTMYLNLHKGLLPVMSVYASNLDARAFEQELRMSFKHMELSDVFGL